MQECFYKQKNDFSKEEISHCVIDYLSVLMSLDETKQDFTDEFYRGYSPGLLFDDG